jgi:MFS transporter, DHA2 family, glioxin efflux transporter
MVVIAVFFRTPKAAKPEEAPLLEKMLQMDLPGTFIIMVAVVCYLLAFQWAGTTKPWNSGAVIGTLVAFGVLVIVFVAIEWYSGDRALLQFRLLKDRTIGAMCAYVGVVCATFFITIYYLPIYFQSTRGVSAAHSGIDNLPLLLGATLFTITSGVLITTFGYYIPLMIIGSAVSAVGAGLIYTLDIHSPSSKWIPYQAVLGIGLGLCFQIPVIVNQSVVKPSDISSVSAMTLFFQTIGGSLFISAGQAAFVNRLVSRVSVTAPGVKPALVVATGATDLRKVFSAHDLPGILIAYLDGLRVAFAITIATACLSFVLAFAPRWQKMNAKGTAPAAV